jgi:hypothetical protein
VNGTAASPAARMTARRAEGSLSGDPKCGPPRAPRRAAAVSSISPWETEARRKAAISAAVTTPALTCGKSPARSKTKAAMAAR